MEWGHLALASIDLHLPEGGSLKTKRRELLRVKSLLARRFAASVAEVDHHDLWQRARISLSMVDRTAGGAAERLDQALRALHGDPAFQVVGEDSGVYPLEDLIGEPEGWPA